MPSRDFNIPQHAHEGESRGVRAGRKGHPALRHGGAHVKPRAVPVGGVHGDHAGKSGGVAADDELAVGIVLVVARSAAVSGEAHFLGPARYAGNWHIPVDGNVSGKIVLIIGGVCLGSVIPSQGDGIRSGSSQHQVGADHMVGIASAADVQHCPVMERDGGTG